MVNDISCMHLTRLVTESICFKGFLFGKEILRFHKCVCGKRKISNLRVCQLE